MPVEKDDRACRMIYLTDTPTLLNVDQIVSSVAIANSIGGYVTWGVVCPIEQGIAISARWRGIEVLYEHSGWSLTSEFTGMSGFMRKTGGMLG